VVDTASHYRHIAAGSPHSRSLARFRHPCHHHLACGVLWRFMPLGNRSQFEGLLSKTKGKRKTRGRYLNLRDQAEILGYQGDKAGIHWPGGAREIPCDGNVTRKAVARRPKPSST